ncbi:MAG: PspC domain-containing protein [Nocardioidaceae bacterium]|nr:PspC domain-containing protein [Nocardioidaceae bacterium]
MDRQHLRNYERLHRSTTDRKFAGVAGGLGRHLNIDPTVLRVLLVVLVFFGGAGVVLYGAAWLLVPEEDADSAVIGTNPSTRNALLIVAAVFAALLLLGDTWGGWGGPFPWPVVVVGLIALVVIAARDKSGAGSSAVRAAPPGIQPPVPGLESAGPETPSGIGAGSTAAPEGPSWTYPAATAPSVSSAPSDPSEPPGSWTGATSYPPPGPKADRGPKLFGFTLAFIAVALGTLGLFDAAGTDVADAAYAALALTVVGVMLLVGSVVGRPGGLVLLGLLATVALAVTATVDRYGYDRTADLSVYPSSSAMLLEDYSMLAGNMEVDLSTIDDLENLDGRTLTLQAEAGDIRVYVPDGLDVHVDARVGVGGEIDVDGEQGQGPNPTVVADIDGGVDVPELTVLVDLTVGTIDVQQVPVNNIEQGNQP